jgi:poly-beta-hydroxyalkanoate depolymerase
MRALICLAIWFSIGSIAAFAQSGHERIENPKVQGENVDRCADIDGTNDCSARGQSKAATEICIAHGYADEMDSHWHPSSGCGHTLRFTIRHARWRGGGSVGIAAQRWRF